MRHNLLLAAALDVLLPFTALSAVHAQDASESEKPPELFQAADAPDWQDPQGDEFVIRSRPVLLNLKLDEEIVLDKPLQLNLFDDTNVTVVFDKVQTRWPTKFTSLPVLPIGYIWSGSLVEPHEGSVVLVTESNLLLANVHINGIGIFEAEPIMWKGDQAQHVIRQIDGEAFGECDTAPQDEELDDLQIAQGSSSLLSGSSCSRTPSACDDGSWVDVMVFYTPLARELASPSDPDDSAPIEAKVDLYVEQTNAAYERSEIAMRLRLVYKGEVDFVEGTLSLARLIDPWDNDADEIHPLRNAMRADLVSILYNGLSNASLMTSEDPSFENQAFSCVAWSNLTYTFAHELGHNMGCAHDRFYYPNCVNNCGCKRGAFYDSFGYHFPPTYPPTAPLYRTIMAYPFPGGSLTQNFSNPDVTYEGYATGEALPSCNAANDAATIDGTSDDVAGFRISDDATDTTISVSLDARACQGNAGSFAASISDNGQYVSFASDATNFGADANSATDVFVYNRESRQVDLVSTTPSQVAGDMASHSPAISGNGKYITFASDATNITYPAESDTTGFSDVFARVNDSRDLTRLSKSTAGVAGNNDSYAPSVSATGRFVAFESLADNLDIGDLSGFRDVFWRDRYVNPTTPPNTFDVSGNVLTKRIVGDSGDEPNGDSFAASFSADGTWIAFESNASNFLAFGQDTNAKRDIFLHNGSTGTTVRISVGPNNLQSDGHCYAASVSEDGQYVSFQSDATNLLGSGNDNNGKTDVFVYDRVNATTICVSRATGSSGALGNFNSYDAKISPNGKFVVFASEATNFESPNNGAIDVFIRDLAQNTTTRLSVNSDGDEGDDDSLSPVVSYDGRFVAFESDAENLVEDDDNEERDVFLRDRGPMLLGDLTGDHRITEIDQDVVVQNWGEDQPRSAADLDHDGDVDADDLVIQLNNWTG